MSTTYTMRVKTGEKKYAGTDANVFAILYGEKDDTGKQQHNLNLMKYSDYFNLFEFVYVFIVYVCRSDQIEGL